MDTRLLTVFLEVVRSGSFAAAARNLDQDPSSVSRSIALLEEDLRVRLFQRTTRKVSLTEAGSHFAARIEPILAELDQAREDIRSFKAQPRGKLRLSVSVGFGQLCVMPHMAEFLERYPEIDVDLLVTDRNVDMVAENVDLAVRMAPSIQVDAIAAKLMPVRYRVCASPEYLSTHGRPELPDDLARRRCVCFDVPEFRTRWLFRRSGAPTQEAPLEIPIVPRFVASGALTVREAALNGIGPALLANWFVEEDLKQGRLIDLFPDHEVTATTFDTAAWLLYPSRSFLPQKVRVMIDFLRERLASG